MYCNVLYCNVMYICDDNHTCSAMLDKSVDLSCAECNYKFCIDCESCSTHASVELKYDRTLHCPWLQTNTNLKWHFQDLSKGTVHQKNQAQSDHSVSPFSFLLSLSLCLLFFILYSLLFCHFVPLIARVEFRVWILFLGYRYDERIISI
jgi:hypothetical protein